MQDEEGLLDGRERRGAARSGAGPSGVAIIVGIIIIAGVVGLILWFTLGGGSGGGGGSSPPPSDVSNITHCRYSTADVALYIDEVNIFFYGTVFGSGNLNVLYTCDFWTYFAVNSSKLGIFPLTDNADYNRTVALRELALSIKADPAVSTLEKLQIDMSLNDLDYYLNLTLLDFFVNQFASYNRVLEAVELRDTFLEDSNWGWCNGIVSSWIATDPALFETVLAQWIANLGPMIDDYQEAWQHQLDVNKTHSNVTMDFQQAIWLEMFTHPFAPLCTLFTNPTLAAQCAIDTSNADIAVANFANMFVNDYLPACAASRPHSAPGLNWLQDGGDAYQVFLNYHLGFSTTADAVYNLGLTRVPDNQAAMLSAGNEFDIFVDFPALALALKNTADSRFYFCNVSEEEVIAYYYNIQGRIISVVNDQMGYVPRVGGMITINGSPSTYNLGGTYDSVRHFWIRPYIFNLGNVADDPEPNNCSAVYNRVDANTLTMHESFPGHGLQIPLLQEINCQLSVNAFPPTSFVEGWALYVETLGFLLGVDGSHPLGLYTDPIQKLGHYNDAMLRNVRLQEDPALHGDVPTLGTNWDFDTAWMFMASNGFSDGYAKSEAQRYITMPGQATAYMSGRIKIEEMRNYTETQLGVDFSAPEFHNILTRWGGTTLANLDILIHTYVTVKLSALPPSDASFNALFGIDLIRTQFSSTLPVVGLGPV